MCQSRMVGLGRWQEAGAARAGDGVPTVPCRVVETLEFTLSQTESQ